MAKSVKQPVETPPYLKQARIREYRSIRDAEIDFKPGVNIIIGENGAGKTNLISLLSRLTDSNNVNRDGVGCEIVLVAKKEFSVLFKHQVIPKVDRNPFDKRPNALSEFLSAEVEEGNAKAEDIFLGNALNKLDWKDNYSVIPIWHGTPTMQLPIINESIDVIVSKSGFVSLESEIGLVRDGVPVLIYSIIDTLRAELMMYLQNTPALTTDAVKSIVVKLMESYSERLNQYLGNYSSIAEVKCNPLIQIYKNSTQDDFTIKGLVLEYNVANEWRPFSALSDGTKRVFYIISQLFTPSLLILNENFDEALMHDFVKIIFLEEPELGIHPEQLHKLLSLIREVSREHQVIMTTHSPQVLDMLSEKELDRITICELDPKKGTQFRKLSPAKRAEAQAYMREQLHLSDFWRYADLEAKD